MGLIAQEYPHSLVDDYATQIRDLFFQTLETTLLNQQEVRVHFMLYAVEFLQINFCSSNFLSSIPSCHYVVR